MEPTLAANARARAAVNAFLQGESSSSEEDDSAAVLTATRPNRLGLGASEETKKTKPEVGSQRARSRLERSIQSQREKEANAPNDANDDDDSVDEGESRTRTVGVKRKRARKVAKAKKAKVENRDIDPKAKHDEGKEVSPEENGPTEDKVAQEDNGETQKSGFQSQRNTGRDIRFVGSNHAPNEGEASRRKRKKTRSRQKNLRRDKRPKHMLPSHLTEETLRAGRLPRHNSAEAGTVGERS